MKIAKISPDESESFFWELMPLATEVLWFITHRKAASHASVAGAWFRPFPSKDARFPITMHVSPHRRHYFCDEAPEWLIVLNFSRESLALLRNNVLDAGAAYEFDVTGDLGAAYRWIIYFKCRGEPEIQYHYKPLRGAYSGMDIRQQIMTI